MCPEQGVQQFCLRSASPLTNPLHGPWSHISIDFVTGLPPSDGNTTILTAQWSGNVLWVEFAHNSLPSVSTGFSTFECVYGYQPPLFQALEREVRVPSAMALSAGAVGSGLGCSRLRSRPQTSTRPPLITATPGAPTTGWDSRCGCPHGTYKSRLTPKNCQPNFVGPLSIIKVVNPVSLKLRLSWNVRIHPSFHVSKVKSVVESPPLPAVPSLPPPCIISKLANTVKRLLAVRRMGQTIPR